MKAYLTTSGGLKNDIADAILERLSQVGFANLGVHPLSHDPMLKRVQMPAAIVEVGFINTDRDNELFDQKFDEIAAAIANGVDAVLDLREAKSPYTYRVQVGGFSNEQNAQRLAFQLMQDGYQPIILLRDPLYLVQVGEIYSLDEAVTLEQFLRVLGYNTFIVTEENL